MALAEKLKEWRLKRSKSLQQLADAVGASKAHIWDLETGRAKNPSVELLTKISSFLGVPLATLVGETQNSDEEAEMIALWRDMKELSEEDREMFRTMILKYRKRGDQ